MRCMQIIEAPGADEARRAYLQMLERTGITVDPTMVIFVETVHRARMQGGAWLCYVTQSMQPAA